MTYVLVLLFAILAAVLCVVGVINYAAKQDGRATACAYLTLAAAAVVWVLTRVEFPR